ncbi:tetratricopeptide repeat protein [Pseudoxanthomonas beigongshangi]
MATWLLAAALALSPQPSLPDAFASPDIPTTQEILAIPPELDQQFRQWMAQSDAGPSPVRLERLVNFLFSKDGGLGLEYRADANYTVDQTYRMRHANCLSFTLMVIALARADGLQAYAQEIEDVLTWYQEGNTVYRNNHVNAGIRIGRQRFSIDVAWDQVIARQQPEAIPDAHLFAMFYNNRAVDLLGDGHAASAQAYLARARALSPEYPAFWNNTGVAALRQGDAPAAERAYLRALALNENYSSALFNLVTFYNRNGRSSEARSLQRRLEQVRAHDPFDQFLLALEHERSGDYEAAVNYYQRAIRLFGSEHRFYLGLARAYLHLGKARRAGRALARAEELSEGATRAQYQAKLERLRRPREPSIFGPQPR